MGEEDAQKAGPDHHRALDGQEDGAGEDGPPHAPDADRRVDQHQDRRDQLDVHLRERREEHLQVEAAGDRRQGHDHRAGDRVDPPDQRARLRMDQLLGKGEDPTRRGIAPHQRDEGEAEHEHREEEGEQDGERRRGAGDGVHQRNGGGGDPGRRVEAKRRHGHAERTQGVAPEVRRDRVPAAGADDRSEFLHEAHGTIPLLAT